MTELVYCGCSRTSWSAVLQAGSVLISHTATAGLNLLYRQLPQQLSTGASDLLIDMGVVQRVHDPALSKDLVHVCYRHFYNHCTETRLLVFLRHDGRKHDMLCIAGV